MDIFEETLGNISGGDVLDIATSRGGFVEELQNHLGSYISITGIDIDDQVLAAARNNFDEDSIQFLKMDAAHMGFENGRFDTVSASAALHHFPNVNQVLCEVERVLKPGGTFIFIEMHREAKTKAQQTVVQMHHWAADIDTSRGVYHNQTFTRQELVNFIEGMGLKNVTLHDFLKTDTDPMDEASIQQCEEAIDTVLKRTATLDLAKKETFQARSEALRIRLHKWGAQWEPVLFVTGKKP